MVNAISELSEGLPRDRLVAILKSALLSIVGLQGIRPHLGIAKSCQLRNQWTRAGLHQ